jgi:hypothetical protein
MSDKAGSFGARPDKLHPLLQRERPTPSDSSSWADGVPEVPSAPEQPIGTNDDALIGPELGMGGTAKPMQVHRAPDPPVLEKFQDVSSLIEKARGS